MPYHVHRGRDARVHQELLAGADVAVRDRPPQVARVHILAHPEVVVRLVDLDLAVLLERRCAQEDTMPSTKHPYYTLDRKEEQGSVRRVTHNRIMHVSREVLSRQPAWPLV